MYIFLYSITATTATWKKISIFVALPGIALCAYQAITTEMEHIAHHERLEFKPYDHLRIRKKVSTCMYSIFLDKKVILNIEKQMNIL